MAYRQTTFISGETLRADQMNNIDQGIVGNMTAIQNLQDEVDNLSNALQRGSYGGDYDADENNSGYIKNRPFVLQKDYIPASLWDGTNSSGIANTTAYGRSCVCIYDELCDEDLLIGGEITAKINGQVYYDVPIVGVARTYSEALSLLSAGYDVNGPIAAFVPGLIFDDTLPYTWTVLAIFPDGVFDPNNHYPNAIALGTFLMEDAIGANMPRGFYAWTSNSGNSYLQQIEFDNVVINEKYQGFFNSLKNRIYAFNFDNSDDEHALDLSRFKNGDILLFTANPR